MFSLRRLWVHLNSLEEPDTARYCGSFCQLLFEEETVLLNSRLLFSDYYSRLIIVLFTHVFSFAGVPLAKESLYEADKS